MMNENIEMLIKIILGIIGIFVGVFISKKMGYSKEANIIKILVIIALLLFLLWNEGVFN